MVGSLVISYRNVLRGKKKCGMHSGDVVPFLQRNLMTMLTTDRQKALPKGLGSDLLREIKRSLDKSASKGLSCHWQVAHTD